MKSIFDLGGAVGLDSRLSEVASQNSQGKVLVKSEVRKAEIDARLKILKQLISEDSTLLSSPVVYEQAKG